MTWLVGYLSADSAHLGALVRAARGRQYRLLRPAEQVVEQALRHCAASREQIIHNAVAQAQQLAEPYRGRYMTWLASYLSVENEYDMEALLQAAQRQPLLALLSVETILMRSLKYFSENRHAEQ